MQREYLYDRPGLPGKAGSPWLDGREKEPLSALSGTATCDVVVVGAGLTGVLTASRLAQGGANVVLLDGRRVCSDVTGHTTAKATAQHGALVANMPEDARDAWLRENIRAVDRLERLAAIAGDATFARQPSMLYTTKSDGVDGLRRELDLYRQLELPGEMIEDGLPDGVHGAVRLDGQALMNPVALCDGLLQHAPESLQVYEQSMVRGVDEDRHAVIAKTDHGEVRASALVVATHVPFFDTLLYSTRLFQERTYALEIAVAEDPPPGLWYSEDPPHLSWRPVVASEPRRLVVSGVSHKAGVGGDEREHYRELARACDARFGGVQVLRHWSTQDPKTADALPLIGKMISRDRCFMASGYNGWGMTSSEVAADILAALIGGGEHAIHDIVAPLRLETSGLVTLAIENADVVAKAFTHEVVSEGDLRDLAAGEGRAMRSGRHHLAAMRDADGTLHASDAHCAHMRCAVEFNEAEGTWDCPCHGSRYYGDGSWLHGPAKRGLERVAVEED